MKKVEELRALVAKMAPSERLKKLKSIETEVRSSKEKYAARSPGVVAMDVTIWLDDLRWLIQRAKLVDGLERLLKEESPARKFLRNRLRAIDEGKAE